MPTKHRAQPGESIDSIAYRYGHFPDRIWDHAQNLELRQTRESRTVLSEGDVVFVPDLEPKQVEVAVDRRHVFRRRGVPARIRLELLAEGKALGGVAWRIEVGNAPMREGETGADGLIETFLPPNVSRARLIWGDAESEVELQVGLLEPISSARGQLQRLANLGFPQAPSHVQLGPEGDRLRAALFEFQAATGLPSTGEMDDATLDYLARVHDAGEDFPE
ncbi:hypothetical protein ENSA5_33190 [Enhygromyxa salina]|uniref:Peptidoglycan binding-like domain-containing protein n=1 Tax=Enhygromyxa salina TaxID=215803 RepID=A0A2S9XXE1_9BACT|nr:peptidoglycan-binding domain-containing protein [Enhygromyxa salina]PRP97522.1 hypothetical protein ENSA5_33190 [Enhygromyxa salina]